MQGKFLIDRNIFENSLWEDTAKFRIFFYILGNAAYKDTKICGINIKRGQYLRSYRNLAKDLCFKENRSYKEYSITTIKRKIDMLVKEQRLEIKDTVSGTLFTVKNYDKYQCFEDIERTKRNSVETVTEQQRNNSETTAKQEELNITKYNEINEIKAATHAREGEDVPTTSPVNSDVPTTGDNDADEQLLKQISELYFNITGRTCNANDYVAVTQVTEQTKNFELIKSVMLDLNNRYKPKFAGDKIKSFKYFVDAILEAAENKKTLFDKKYADDERLNEEFRKFIRHRAKMGRPIYDDDDAKQLLNKLKNLEPDSIDNQIQILENSRLNGWTGIFPLKQQEKPQNKSRFVNYEQRKFDPVKMRELEKMIVEKELESLNIPDKINRSENIDI